MNNFDNFVAKHFNGFSAKTFFDFLCEASPDREVPCRWIYNNLYHCYIGDYTFVDVEIFGMLKAIAFQDPAFRCKVKEVQNEIKELEYVMEHNYKPINVPWLKENCLDWYLKGLISVEQMTLICKL